ncbi:MAG: hypothetical protein FWG18_02065 [Alphaproteobacteria bacterium]|nr:hypothetical protein [Alphaproteobacteria bacterium]
MVKIARFLILPIILSCWMASDARAVNWCQKPDGKGMYVCDDVPVNLFSCGEFKGDPAFCNNPTGRAVSNKNKNSDATKSILIGVAAGAVFVGVMWYLFRTPASDTAPGSVKLASF